MDWHHSGRKEGMEKWNRAGAELDDKLNQARSREPAFADQGGVQRIYVNVEDYSGRWLDGIGSPPCTRAASTRTLRPQASAGTAAIAVLATGPDTTSSSSA